ncbi:MAG: MipA/OmpV family protein [Woeseiaceae bacterium]|nr:MipA/OmpV family protein [Woeseiaceae bacterium]
MDATVSLVKKRLKTIPRTFALVLLALPLIASAADLTVRLDNAPESGNLVFQVYDAADAFGDFRDPAQEVVLPARGDGEYELSDVRTGKIAVLVYHDENGNGLIDKNFIGIPRESLALSNDYQPKGPPRFARASFEFGSEQAAGIDMSMYQVLGERGRVGLGVGVIGRSSPYVESTQAVTQVIPAVTYVGERMQWFGPLLRYGIAGSGRLRLAAAAEYRIGSYEESDSPVLQGLGDRDGTVLGGLALQYEIAEGFELEMLYQHDVLDRIGGGMANVRLSRGIPLGSANIEPFVAYNWLGSEISNHDFGVPAASATAERPAYQLGSTQSFEAGIGTFIELSEDWRIIVNLSGERLDDDVTASPIVDDDIVFKGLAIVSYVF